MPHILYKPLYLDKTHPDGAHLGEFIHHLEAMINRLRQQLGKQLVVEDLEAASTRDLADGGGVETMLVVTVPTLNENTAVTQTLCVHLPSDVIQVHSYNRRVKRFKSMLVVAHLTETKYTYRSTKIIKNNIYSITTILKWLS